MDLSASTMWWLAAGALVAVELTTGTFYLLMLALGAVAGAMSAHLGLSTSSQVLFAAALGAGATVAWHLKRRLHPAAAPAASNPDVNLDIGQVLHVKAWQDDGTARVPYRGALWSVRLAPGHAAAAGAHRVLSIQGSELQLAPVAPVTPAGLAVPGSN